jgi:colanic acid/amylovoran biosynthesis glycosyltransferase
VVLLDAQATGMPVISTTHCDIPSEVIDGETGLLAPERDVGGLAEHIRRFYAMDASEYQGFCKRARKHVEEQYDIARNAVALRDIYQDVIDRAASSQRRAR